MAANFKFDLLPHLRSSWNPTAMMMRGKLTDKKIDKYVAQGYYSASFRAARKEFMENKAKKRQERREGNFVVRPDGTRLYSPL